MDVPLRSEVPQKDRWNLSQLFPADKAWQQALETFIMDYKMLPSYEKTLGKSAADLKEALDAYMECDMRAERLGYYAMLRLQENLGDAQANRNYAKFLQVQSEYARIISFFRPKIQEINEMTLRSWCETETLLPYRTYLEHIMRYKPHILSADQEELLAPLGELFNTPDQAFSALTDVDMNFGDVEVNGQIMPLTQSTYTTLLKKEDPKLREKVYHQFYSVFDQHKNVLAALYSGSIRQDLYNARVRHFNTAREAALFADDMPLSVYDNLIKTVRANLGVLHEYYELRRKLLKMDRLRHCDVYAQLVPAVKTEYSYEEGAKLICQAMAPLGKEYCETLQKGLLGHWVDKYENKGKSSGAFSAGSYLGEPYILMNYKSENLRSLFTLAHEAGHSMHSLYSVQNNSYQDYNYSIFEAETASTFNEALLFHYLSENNSDPQFKKYLISERIDDILATLFRQTMFAEFELRVHQDATDGHPPTLESLRKTYRDLQEAYFGPHVDLSAISDLEGLRIPHFYHAFYVYKYATGIAASLALSQKVLKGNDQDRQSYIAFLKSGGSRFPLESLRLAGVDMSSAEPIEMAINYFKELTKVLSEMA